MVFRKSAVGFVAHNDQSLAQLYADFDRTRKLLARRRILNS